MHTKMLAGWRMVRLRDGSKKPWTLVPPDAFVPPGTPECVLTEQGKLIARSLN